MTEFMGRRPGDSTKGSMNEKAIFAFIIVAGVVAVGFVGMTPTSTITQTSALIRSSTVAVPSNVSASNSTIQSTNQSTNQSSSTSIQYPLVWQSTSPTVCDMNSFCVVATLGFSGQTATASESATAITGSNGTTIVVSSTTTIIRTSPYPQTTVIEPPQNTSYVVVVTAFVQDAVTGQNVTTSSGQSSLGAGCDIQPSGFTHCIISAPSGLPSGTYKVTVFVTKEYNPCSIRVAGYPCTSQLLAPPSQTITITE